MLILSQLPGGHGTIMQGALSQKVTRDRVCAGVTETAERRLASQLLHSLCEGFPAILILLEAVQDVQEAAVHLRIRRRVREELRHAALVVDG